MVKKEPVSAQSLGADSATATPWEEADGRLREAETYWVATVLPKGGPHVMPVMGVWFDSALHFTSSEKSRRATNLARNSRCVVTVGSLALPALDLVVEGAAERVSDDAELHAVADAYSSKYGWHVTVRDEAFYGDGAPTAGPPPYAVFKVTPITVFGLPGIRETDEKGQRTEGSFTPTRWRF